MENAFCPQCNRESFDATNRIVRDSCGHFKCRLCLLYETDGCITCRPPKSAVAIINGPLDVNSVSAASTEDKNTLDLIKPNKIPKIVTEIPITFEKSDLNSTLRQTKPHSKCRSRTTNPKFEKSNIIRVRLPENVCIDSVDSSNKAVYRCNVCNKEFHSRSHIAYHAHCGRPKPFSCTLCQKGFSTKSAYNHHIQVHSGKRPFMCDVCGKSFFQRSKLKRHVLLHTGEKAFCCNDCGASFNNAASLNKHGFIHSGLKPYICDVCQKSFRDTSNLRKHERKHMNLMYSCAECGKQYVKKWSLIVHAKSHRDVRPYSCKQCKKSFYEKKDKQRHELIHSDIKPFKCKVCSSKFLRKDNLDRHIRNTHPGIVSSVAVEKVPNGVQSKQIFKNLVTEKEYFNHNNKHSKEGLEDRNGCIVSGISVHNEINVQMSLKTDSIIEDKTKNMKDSIIEANNRRQSVIFSPVRSQLLLTENNVYVQEAQGKKPATEVNEWDKVVEENVNIKNSKSDEKVLPIAEDNETKEISEESINEKHIDCYANYIHKKVNYEMNKGFSKWASRQVSDPPDLSKLESYKNPEPVCTPESIELYKKILMPSYRSSEMALSDSNESSNNSNGNNFKPSTCDIHWRRRMAHSSS